MPTFKRKMENQFTRKGICDLAALEDAAAIGAAGEVRKRIRALNARAFLSIEDWKLRRDMWRLWGYFKPSVRLKALEVLIFWSTRNGNNTAGGETPD